MSEHEDRDEHPRPDAEVIPLRGHDSEVPAPAGDHGGTVPGGAEEKRRDIIPERFQRGQIRGTLAEHAGRGWFHLRFHGIRLVPVYVPWFTWLALRGIRALTGRLAGWWGASSLWLLESQAVAAGRAGHHEAMRAHTEGKKTRGQRGRIVGVCAVIAAVVLLALWHYLRWWAMGPLIGVTVPVLIWHGRPEDRPIVRPATLPSAYSVPTPEIITDALCSVGIEKINAYVKQHGILERVIDLHRDGEGWGSEWDLPRGVTAKMIIQRREQLASGLRRPLSAVWPEPVPHEHEGRLFLWIGRHDMAKVKPPAYPLLKSGTADIFGHVPFAVVPRGTGVTVPMFQANHLIGAAPGEGKTNAVRVVNCNASLDVICDLWTHELAGKGDLEAFAQVAHRYCSGLDDEAIEYAAMSAAKLRSELEQRSRILKKIPREKRPEGALTRDLAAADPRLRPIVATFDECQNLFLHPEYGTDAADDLAHVMRLGRAYGIIVVLATQRPDKDCLPTQISGLVQVRFCLKVGDYLANDMILGTGAYKAGFNAVAFRHEIDAGLGWLRGTGDAQAVRTYKVNLNAAARVTARARAMREAAGVLSGYALGEDGDDRPRSFAADVLMVFGTDAKLWCSTVAERLRMRIPEAYADITPAAVSSQLREIGVEVKNVREPGSLPNLGCDRAALERIVRPAEVHGA